MALRPINLLLALLWSVLLLAEVEAGQNRVPANVLKALNAPEELTVFSINPNPRAIHWWFSRWFHGYRIIGKVIVKDHALRGEAAAVVRESALEYRGSSKCVIMPRHGVRVVSKYGSFDFVICYECSKMIIYEGDEVVATLDSGGSSQVLDGILRAARVRQAK